MIEFNLGAFRSLQFGVDLFFRIFFQVQYVGLENIPAAGPVVLASNHPSYFDPVLLQHATRRWIRFLALKEILDWPVVGPLCRAAGMVQVGDETGQKGHALWRAIQVLEGAGVVGIFPEGGRSKGPVMGPSKPGLGLLALVPGTAVVPVVVIGSMEAWPREFALPAPRKIVVTFLPPMRFDGPAETGNYRRIADEVRSKIVEVQMKYPRGPAPKGSKLRHAARY